MKNFKVNWQTSIIGIISIGLAVYQCIRGGQFDINCILQALAGLGFIFAKDGNVTGGTVPASPEAAVRVETGTKALDPVAVEKTAEKAKQI